MGARKNRERGTQSSADHIEHRFSLDRTTQGTDVLPNALLGHYKRRPHMGCRMRRPAIGVLETLPVKHRMHSTAECYVICRALRGKLVHDPQRLPGDREGMHRSAMGRRVPEEAARAIHASRQASKCSYLSFIRRPPVSMPGTFSNTSVTSWAENW